MKKITVLNLIITASIT